MHASQDDRSACEAGKHVQVEIPMADNLEGFARKS